MKRLILFLFSIVLISSVLSAQNKNKKGMSKVMNTNFIHWYGQSAFRIEDSKKQIFIDPFKLPNNIETKADIILITHGHYDHFSPDDIEKIKTPETIIITTQDVAEKLKGNKGNTFTLKPDQTIESGNIKISAVPAYNLEKKYHPKTNEWVGFIIHLSNGLTIYHAGDTDVIPDLENIKTDVALVPVGGTYTMTAEEAAKIINIIQPKVSIPMHYGGIVGTNKDAETFKKLVKTPVVIKTQEK
jgi:L-ascorbate metabolism protein UlaG (beta-lactamase superfamily)